MGLTKRLSAAAWVLIFPVAVVPADDFLPVFKAPWMSAVTDALDWLNMTLQDLTFEKDVAQPRLVPSVVRRVLAAPLELPRVADRIFSAFTEGRGQAPCDLAADFLDVSDFPGPDWATDLDEVQATAEALLDRAGVDLDPALRHALVKAFPTIASACRHLTASLARLSPDERMQAAASFYADLVSLEDFPDRRAVLAEAGLSTGALERALQEALAVDPKPAAEFHLGCVERLDLAALLRAARDVARVLDQLRDGVSCNLSWPKEPVQIGTPLGAIWIGTPSADRYTQPALLLLDPGGDDLYTGEAGHANGLKGYPMALILDLDGQDLYLGTGLLGPGSAVFGIAGILDRRGRDTYRARWTGQASAFFGVAFLSDEDGDDVYEATSFAQAAAYAGLAWLEERDGNDLYTVGFCGQAYAEGRAVALLADRRGQDRYLAGGQRPDFERHEDRFLSLAQGFSIGRRPFGGGGIAALVDAEGNDVYEADVYGQGAAYWYAIGVLLDRAGHDAYRGCHYVQGSGIHLAAGLLADGGGNDRYSGHILAQAAAHDYGVGLLLEHGGDDTYTADTRSQARAMNNAVALLLDAAGHDAYFARDPDTCQATGDLGGYREYGSLALLLDLLGHDRYAVNVRAGGRLLRPLFGIVYDGTREPGE